MPDRLFLINGPTVQGDRGHIGKVGVLFTDDHYYLQHTTGLTLSDAGSLSTQWFRDEDLIEIVPAPTTDVAELERWLES
jgi:hypothetical protein